MEGQMKDKRNKDRIQKRGNSRKRKKMNKEPVRWEDWRQKGIRLLQLFLRENEENKRNWSINIEMFSLAIIRNQVNFHIYKTWAQSVESSSGPNLPEPTGPVTCYLHVFMTAQTKKEFDNDIQTRRIRVVNHGGGVFMMRACSGSTKAQTGSWTKFLNSRAALQQNTTMNQNTAII